MTDTFVAHAQLKNVIGRDLINDDGIAIVELVKNGLDAGSPEVHLEFQSGLVAFDKETLSGSITIRDFGSGMTIGDIRSKWLNIAYSEKRHKQSDSVPLAGNKGVGRFACDRLGIGLDLYTGRVGSTAHHVRVDWRKFDEQDTPEYLINSIAVSVSECDAETFKKQLRKTSTASGTVLIIKGLRADWDREKLITLRRTLERFIDPNAAIAHGGFAVSIDAPDEKVADAKTTGPKVNGPISNEILDKLRFNTTYIESQCDSISSTMTTTLHHGGRQIYKVTEKYDDAKNFGDAAIVLHYMNSYKKSYFKKQTGLHAVDFGSVFLFVNGFRVPPYGDRLNDWLGLDNRKNQGQSRHLACRELLGRIIIKDPDRERFRVASNREGMVQTPEFQSLISRDGFFFRALKRLERFVVDGLDWDSVSSAAKKLLDRSVDGLAVNESNEDYDESTEKKERRIALDIVRLVDAEPAEVLELTIDSKLLSRITSERAEEVAQLLEKLQSFDDASDKSLRSTLGKVRKAYERQTEELRKATQSAERQARRVERLRRAATKGRATKQQLKNAASTSAAEALFLRTNSSVDHETLTLFMHQIALNAENARGFLEQVDATSTDKTSSLIGKAIFSIQKIITVSQFATKANFKLRSQTISADLCAFCTQYISTVASEFSAANLIVHPPDAANVRLEMRFRPIDVAIIFDNIASNSTRVGARNLWFDIKQLTPNEIEIVAKDDGPGLSPAIQPPDSVFKAGVTSTKGSGLGLFHLKQTVEAMGGTVRRAAGVGSGFGLSIRIVK